jgi:hypothetical protein
MIDGWLANPRFLFHENITWKTPGDMNTSISPSMEWKRRSNPPIIWTTHQACMLYFLIHLYQLGGWHDCKGWTVRIGQWTERNQQFCMPGYGLGLYIRKNGQSDAYMSPKGIFVTVILIVTV